MKKVSLIAFATCLFLFEVASAQQFKLQLPGVGGINVDLGGGRRNRQNPPPVRRNPAPVVVPRVDVNIGNFNFKLGRGRIWQQNRAVWGRNAESAVEPGTRLIGFTMLSSSDFDFDFDNVEIRNKNFSDAVKLKVINDGAFIDRLSINFCEGGSEIFRFSDRFASNSSTGWIDLPGRSRCISSFSVSGQGDRDRDGIQPTVVLLGREPLPQFNRRGHWNSHRENYQQLVRSALTGHTESGERLVGHAMLSENTFDFETVEVSHQENVDEVRLWVIGDSAFIDTLSIQFCNNFSNPESFSFRHDIQQNGISPWMDLRGANRCIKKFAVSGKGSRGLGDSIIILTGRNRPGNGGFSNFPQPLPPVPVGPACELLGYGYQNGNYWNYRVRVSGSVLHATDSLDSIIKSINDLQAAGVCAKQPVATTLSGYTYYRGDYWQFALKMNDQIVFVSDDFNDTLQAINKLHANDLGFPHANDKCQLMGPGRYRNYSWSNRVAVGASVVFGEDDLEDAIWFMSKIRQVGFCQ